MIKREELVNSIEYWQTQHEILCYRENIKPTLQLANKQEMIEKACDILVDMLNDGTIESRDIGKVNTRIRKTMEE